ncbi:MAG: hypothetical protein HDQ88_00240 [Clostridia bacterium]|nr:hypothetical protein [Clostridia bacterium]
MKSKKWLAMLLASLMIVPVAIAGCNDNGGKDDDKDDTTQTPGDDEQTPGNDDQTPGDDTPAEDTSTKLTGKIYLVGDSTVCGFSDNYYIPRYGYGTQLYNYINCDANQIVNLALSGRSSVSFVAENNYNTLKNSLSAGDYLIIGFGHNDQKADIYSNPNGDKDTEGSFQYSLYENYVKLAESKNATPILCTPIVRLNEKDDYTGSSGHIVDEVATGKPGGNYAQAIRDLGTATNTTVVDLTELTKADYTAIGHEKASDYHCWTATKGGVRDGLDKTHTNLYGAKMNAYRFANAILESDSSLKVNVRTNITKPDHDTEYAASINKNYVEPDYVAPDLTKRSSEWTINADSEWYGSVFGDIGGESAAKASNYTVNQLSENSFKIGNTSGKGKIASGGDGIACVFQKLDPNQNFTITASVTLTNVESSASKQSAFGIMLRDDMYIDKYNASINSNSAIAGGYTGSSDSATCVYNYQRLDGKLDTAGSKSATGTTFTKDDTYTIEMVKSDRTITCKVTKGATTYTTTYTDVTYTGVDTNNVYLCLFATRGIVATFTDVTYTAGNISAGA